MDDNIKTWVSRPDVCRCCLSTSGFWDLNEAYVNDGVKEVYSDMLHETFGISLFHTSEWESHLVCNECAGHLRDAFSFKKKALRAEEVFIEYWNCVNDKNILTKQDEESLLNCMETGFQDAFDENHEIKTEPDLPDIKRKNIKVKKLKKTKTTRVETCNDSDSDVPIAELSMKNLINVKNEEKIIRNPQMPATKQISERKRVMLTCSVVLQDTTACPFRHHKSWFQCFFCPQDFMDITSLKKHNLENHIDLNTELKSLKRYPRTLQIDIKNLSCKLCNTSLVNIDCMKEHLFLKHNKVVYNEFIADYKIDISPYICHICDQEFHVFRTLTTHLNEHYANCICDVCGRSFINSKRLKVHKRIHENGTFPCSECDKVFKSKMSITNHIESAHSKRVLKCQICFKPMKHYNDRIKHMSEVHNITYKFKCHICPREFHIKHYLATHVRQTHGNKNKKCATCGMAFITNHGLKKHMVRHANRNVRGAV